ncbi:hypothetical protein [Paenibacillus oleatilyticus]|uniref:hypothetical protein n=1 Tax=Paenibacillus oleatilyticus TaxID=2594886 RepID=UPI001C1F31CA|nr:hypothetical protein [Paenibacillus oleatilyticus]MBU7316003.1 hypothetical protein [Paenibacillus oleatilyticus]
MLLPARPVPFPVGSIYKKDDYIFVKDEKKVYKIVAMFDENTYAAYRIDGGGSRFFDIKRKHYRKAKEDEVLLATHKIKY